MILHRLQPSRRAPMLAALTLLALAMTDADAQPAGYNYDESKVPAYVLPDPLIDSSGTAVKDAAAWPARRLEILDLLAQHVYGRSPAAPQRTAAAQVSVDPQALGGLATRKEVDLLLTDVPGGPVLRLLIYLPNGAPRPVPAFLGYNFNGNHTVHADPGIARSQQWMRDANREGTVQHRATESSRGRSSSRWPIETILGRGYALATAYYGDVEPDHAEGWKTSVRQWIRPANGTDADAAAAKSDAPGAPPGAAADDWGAIGAWAWALSRAMDYFETDADIRQDQVAVMGHSRLGKTSLWAGARDERFAIVISNDSGCGGAALSRRRFGETVERINTSFPHWFCGNFKRYNGREDDLPVDQHMLIAAIAPRPVYVASAETDLWADPRGEFLAAKHADPVYRLLGRPGLGVEEPPALNRPVGDTVGYHIRSGGHDVTDFDWQQYLNFADRHFRRPPQ